MADHQHTHGGDRHSRENDNDHDHNHEHGHDHEHEHTHDHDHDHNHDHVHEHDHDYQILAGKKRVKVKVKETPGPISIDRQIHDEAITISASMTVITENPLIRELIAGEIESAAREIIKRDGIVGHIKAAVSTTSTCMITAADETAMVKDSPMRRSRITLAAIVFLVDPGDAEDIIRKALQNILLAGSE